ncbi:MAG: hypothetical protein JSU65_06190 [Candidatus Zixiibacteriota bacterium]|nr:MAG: hypothetical protein JSU65_06190 [candidate division Zixibacteria bacterium]
MMKCALALSFILLPGINLPAQSPGQKEEPAYNAESKSIVVPYGEGQQIVIDGMISEGEWEDALTFPISEAYDVCLKADSQMLYVAVKSPTLVVIGVCEIRMTENEKDVYLLHVSGRLGEGLSGFPAGTRFEMGNIKHWDANLSKEDETKIDAWVAAGRPIEKYGDVVEKVESKEFKISRKMFSGNRLKLTIGLIEIAADGKKTYNYPENAGLENADNWVELILPPSAN